MMALARIAAAVQIVACSYLPGHMHVHLHFVHCCSQWLTCVCPPNGISIGSAVLQGSRLCPTHTHTYTHTQTDHAYTRAVSAPLMCLVYSHIALYGLRTGNDDVGQSTQPKTGWPRSVRFPQAPNLSLSLPLSLFVSVCVCMFVCACAWGSLITVNHVVCFARPFYRHTLLIFARSRSQHMQIYATLFSQMFLLSKATLSGMRNR